VPAIIVSPLIPKNMIDHTQYDHTSILATLRDRFGTRHLTKRDAAASSFGHVFRLPKAREDAPMALPHPAEAESALVIGSPARKVPDETPLSALPDSTKTFILAAAVADRKARGEGSGPAVATDVLSLQTVGDVRRYADKVRARVALRPRIRRPPLRGRNGKTEGTQ
jgi:phospholipase C